MRPYQQAIAQIGLEPEPRIIEAYMRLEERSGGLDGLSRWQFEQAARRAAAEAEADGPELAEALAASYGL